MKYTKYTPPIPPLPERMWRNHRSYFAFPMIEEDLELEDFDEWRTVEAIVEKAKVGSFAHIQAVLGTFDSDAHWVRRGAYIGILGDAGTEAINERVLRELQGNLPADYCWDFAELLYEWGRLDAVPVLIAGWRAGYIWQDARHIPPRLSMLLEEHEGPICNHFPRPMKREPTPEDDAAADAYFERVTARHAELAERFGEQAFVFRGRLLHPAWIAECGLRDLADNPRDFDSRMRQKFEAMTGIDCSAFYEDGDLRPLAAAAAAIFEAFLASDAPARFTPGKRYFFGHPIPYGDPKGANAWPPY